jgi:hypothetical protein
VRALDWAHPVASTLRCGLFEDALARAQAGAIDPSSYPDQAGLAAAFFELALVLPSGRSLADAGEQLYALRDAGDATAVASLREGDPSALRTDLAGLGAAIDAELDTLATPVGRELLETERIRRGCLLRARFATAPLIPGLGPTSDDCPDLGD